MSKEIDFNKPHGYIIVLLIIIACGVLCNYFWGDKGTFIYTGIILILLGAFFILGGIYGT